jgi:prepilin signal peptidase PulO-like enzyme (type II secretory pathway)
MPREATQDKPKRSDSYDAPRRKVMIVRITVRIVTRWLIVLVAALFAVVVTWGLAQHFFHLARDVSLAVIGLVGGSIVTVFGRWVFQEEKTGRPATADGKLNAFPGSWVFSHGRRGQ